MAAHRDHAAPADASALLPMELRARLRDIEIVPHRARGARGFGLHASPSRGAGLEFAQYRAYEPGDELRQVDWKLYARSDRYFVREAERDSPLDLWLLLDTSASMSQADAARPDWSRLDAARTLATCCIEIALQQGDRFGVLGAGAAGLQVTALGQAPRHRDRCLLALRSLRPSGGWADDGQLRPVWEAIRPQQLVIAIGDQFDDQAIGLLSDLSAARREVVCIQLLTVEERDFPFRGGQRFHDPETGAELLGDGASVRDGFLQRFAEARAALASRFAAAGIRHATCFMDEPLDAPLRTLFPAAKGQRRA